MTIPSAAVAFDRRTFFAGALAAPLLPASARAGNAHRVAPRRGGKLTLAEVLAGAHALLATHVQGEAANDEAWVHGATALFAQLDALPPDPFGAMTERERTFLGERGWTFRRVDGAPAERTRPAVITHQIHVPPNGRIPLHDHRNLFGAVVVAAGELTIRGFDVVEGDRTTPAVVLRETSHAFLRPGRFALLTRDRDNVHEFRAGPDGARVLDLFAWLDTNAGSHDLRWLDDPTTTPAGRRYRAAWA